jgi:hypothetical protein
MRSVRACLKKDRRVDDDVILSYLVVFTNVVLDSNATTVCMSATTKRFDSLPAKCGEGARLSFYR